ncbi:PilW family protein [Roseateles sp. So40a]|uniref:PilW family protein n=1 Tax=Roseateles sp. So40a TaxID=3400226 RepID=UPI003A8C2F05
MTLHPTPARVAARGFSLIELMVSMVIALTVIVAMTMVSARFETSKRQDATTSDLATNSGYLAYDFDRQLRSAGSGFTAVNRAEIFGCALYASKANARILPAPSAFPAPFATVDTTVRMLPVLAFAGAGSGGSDVLQVMTGTGGVGETSSQMRLRSATAANFRLTTTVGIRGDDLLLVTENGRPCMLEQVTSTYTGGLSQQVDLAGSYYASAIGTESITDRSTGATANAAVLGNATNGNPPKLMLLGVSDANQLVRYDLLRFTNGDSEAPVPLSDGVVDMRVRYGVDTTGTPDGILDAWVAPTGGTYGSAALNAGTTAATATMGRILAVKVSLVLRSEFRETKDATDVTVAPATMTMFPSLPTSLQVNYTVTDRSRRHRVLEFTIPLRNTLANVR